MSRYRMWRACRFGVIVFALALPGLGSPGVARVVDPGGGMPLVAVTEGPSLAPDEGRLLAVVAADVDGDHRPEAVAAAWRDGAGSLAAAAVDPGPVAWAPLRLGALRTVAPLPVRPDLLAARCDAAHSPCELWVAARGGDRVVAVTRNRVTGEWTVRTVAVPGRVTALAVGELGVPDGLAEVAVGLSTDGGGAVAVIPGVPFEPGEARPPLDPLPEPLLVPHARPVTGVAFTEAVVPGRGGLVVTDREGSAVFAPPRPGGVLDAGTIRGSAVAGGRLPAGTIVRGAVTLDGEPRLAVASERGFVLAGPGGPERAGGQAGVPEVPPVAVPWRGGAVLSASGAEVRLFRPSVCPDEASPAPAGSVVPVPGARLTALAPLEGTARALTPVVVLAERAGGGSVLAALAPTARAAFTVDSVADLPDANPGDGSCATVLNTCTLRAAIQETNALAGADAIAFAADMTIQPATELPAISDSVTIDGGSHTVVIDGANLPAGSNGLVVTGDDVTITNLDVRNVPAGSAADEGNGIFLEGSLNDRVDNARISSVSITGCGNCGLCVFSATHGWFGPDLECSGNAGDGILQAYYSDWNRFSGVTATENGDDGMELGARIGTVVGTCSGGAEATFLGNAGDGLDITVIFTGTEVCGCGSGISPVRGDGRADANGRGVRVQGTGGVSMTGLVVSGNTGEGVLFTVVDGSTNPYTLQSSVIGLDAAGNVAAGNGGIGIDVVSSNGITLGSSNIVSGNGSAGIRVDGDSSGIEIRSSKIGITDSYLAAGNHGPGVRLDDGSTDVDITTCAFGGNTGAGVLVEGGVDTYRARIEWNGFGGGYGAPYPPNGGGGIVVDGAAHVRIEHNGFNGETKSIIVFNGGYALIDKTNFFSDCRQVCIDLGADGITPNDSGDGDTGANDLLNYPVLGSARACGGETHVPMGMLDIPSAYGTATVVIYASDACATSGNGPAEDDVATVFVPSGGSMFTATIPGELTGQVLTAMTIASRDPGLGIGSIAMTSELSPCVTVQPTYGGDADDDCSWDARDLALIIGALHGEPLPAGGNPDCDDSGDTGNADLPCTANEIFIPHVL